MMRGVYCDGASVRLRRDLPAPEPGTGDVVLRSCAAGICETDLQLVRVTWDSRPARPRVHRRDGRRTPGDGRDQQPLPALRHLPRRPSPALPEPDRSGHLQPRRRAMAERVSVPEANLHEVPDSIGDRTALFIEPLAAAFRITEQIDLGPGTSLAILGDGKLGLLWPAGSPAWPGPV